MYVCSLYVGLCSLTIMLDGVSGIGIDSGSRFCIFLSIYPDNPFDASSWNIFIFHCSKFSPLNFCSSESIVSEGVPDIVML